MKKVIALMLALCMLLGVLTGCQSSQSEASASAAASAASEAPEAAASAAEAATEAPAAEAATEPAAEATTAPAVSGTELTPEAAQALIEDYFDVWAVYLAACDGAMTFRCYDNFDAKTNNFTDYVGLVEIDVNTTAMTVLDGMLHATDKIAEDPEVTTAPTPTPAAEETKAVATMYIANVDVACYLLETNDPSHSDILDTIPLATEVEVLDNTGVTFWQVRYNDKTGYVNKCFLATTKPEKEYKIIDYLYVNNVDVACYLLSDIDTKEVMGTVYLGTQVGLIEKTTNSYYLVNYKGMIGYISSSYLTATAPASTVKVTKDMYVANVNISCYLWADATGLTAVDQIPLGTKIGYVDAANDTYYRVVYGDQVGYVNKAYLSDTAPGDATPTATPAPSATPAAADDTYTFTGEDGATYMIVAGRNTWETAGWAAYDNNGSIATITTVEDFNEYWTQADISGLDLQYLWVDVSLETVSNMDLRYENDVTEEGEDQVIMCLTPLGWRCIDVKSSGEGISKAGVVIRID